MGAGVPWAMTGFLRFFFVICGIGHRIHAVGDHADDFCSIQVAQKALGLGQSNSKDDAEGGILFIMAEAYPFVLMPAENDIPPFHGKYSTAALIYLTVSHASILDFYTEATNKVKKNNPSLKIEHWLQFDTDQHDDSEPTTACKANTAAGCAAYIEAKVKDANNRLKGPTIQGIHFDNEGVGNNLQALTEAFAQVREKLGVKISFTKGISNCASPKVLNTAFDYCLGQSYTDDTANLYAQTSCRRVDTAALWDAWNQKNPFVEEGYSVPTLCAGGNCQGDMPGFLVSRGGPCNIDERLDTTGIAEVIQSVDREKFPNLALWYGNNLHFGGRPPCARCAGRDGIPARPNTRNRSYRSGRRWGLSSVNCNTLLTDVVPCRRNIKCEAVLSKCEGNWEAKGWSSYCKANGICHFSQVLPPSPCSEFSLEIEACKKLNTSAEWADGRGACSFNEDLEEFAMQDFVNSHVSPTYTYLGGEKVTNCTPDGLLCTKGEGNVDAKNHGACQRQVGGMGMLVGIESEPPSYEDICEEEELCGEDATTEDCLRGMCLNKLPSKPSLPPMPKILLYHGGIVGAPQTSTACYEQYLNDILRFITEKRIDTILLNVMAPIPASESHAAQFPYYADPKWIAEKFLDKLPAGVKAGALFGNVKLNSSGWDFQNSSYNLFKDDLRGGPKLGLKPGCNGHDLSKCSCTELNELQSSAGDCPIDQASCVVPGNCPPGCPNLAAQLVTWLATVNTHATNVKFTTIAMDGEDGGDSATDWGLCQFKLMGDEFEITNVGMAKAISAGPQSPGVTFTMPETYWYMGELWPCTGDHWQLQQKPPICTSLSSYRSFVDKPWPFLQWLKGADQVMQQKPGFPSLIDNIAYAKATGKSVVPMFSFEGLSLESCFATHYNAGVKNVSDICGTFDGFSFWQWETFTEFLRYFAFEFGVDAVGIYDLQFIPADWFDNKEFGPNDQCTAP